MFVRFRERDGRLLVSLAETRRVGGKVQQEHVADLGAIDGEPTVEARIAFWKRLHERLARLGNRLDAAKLASILGAINKRIPMAAVEELPAARVAQAERSLKWWQAHHDNCQEQVELHRKLKELIEGKIEFFQAQVARAELNIEKAHAAIADRSKPVPFELTPAEVNRMLRKAGVTKQQAHRMRKLGVMSDQEFEQYLTRRQQRHQ